MVSRALRAISTANCGSPHRWRVSFFARAKKETKESTPRSRRNLPALLARPGARLTRRVHTTRLGLDQKSRDTPEAGCDARRRLRGFKKTNLFHALLD